MHDGQSVRNVAVDDGARAVAVVEGPAIAREDVDDHRLARPERAGAHVVAICPFPAPGNDRRCVDVAPVEKPVVDRRANALGG